MWDPQVVLTKTGCPTFLPKSSLTSRCKKKTRIQRASCWRGVSRGTSRILPGAVGAARPLRLGALSVVGSKGSSKGTEDPNMARFVLPWETPFSTTRRGSPPNKRREVFKIVVFCWVVFLLGRNNSFWGCPVVACRRAKTHDTKP